MISDQSYLFCGVGGSGMSALAKVLLSKGATVYGSDRNYDHGRFPELYQGLKDKGVIMVPQDGSGVTPNLTAVIVSSAVEPSIPDVKAAQDLNVTIIKRAALLADICNSAATSVCIAGTNGKSTVTGMAGWVLHQAGLNPTIINGGGMLNFDRENALIGSPDLIVAETDESDGSVTGFHPSIAVLNNISEDHKDLDELMAIFRQFLRQSQVQILNMDCPNVAKLADDFPNAVMFSASDPETPFPLIVPGQHNQINALATLKVADHLQIQKEKTLQALAQFKGITSRLEVIGDANGITVIDDFGHNPDKISASLKTLKQENRRLILMYQPHGFKPTRQHKNQLIDIFASLLDKHDLFYMPEILYFGGTVDKDISSKDIIDPVAARGVQAFFFEAKDQIKTRILDNVRPGDIICIMGARDDSLRAMARDIFKAVKAI